MLIAKILHRHKPPEFWHLIRRDAEGWTLINYPLHLPYRKREARWVRLEACYVDWIRDFVNPASP